MFVEETNFDFILKALKNNCYVYDSEGQNRDVNLICNFLKIKYDSNEIKDVSIMLIKKINNCLDKKESWFTNY